MKNEYNPGTVSPPGDTLWDWMEEQGIDVGFVKMWLRRRLGLETHVFSNLLNGTLPITPDLADKLEQATSIPAKFWLERERLYREAQCKSE